MTCMTCSSPTKARRPWPADVATQKLSRRRRAALAPQRVFIARGPVLGFEKAA